MEEVPNTKNAVNENAQMPMQKRCNTADPKVYWISMLIALLVNAFISKKCLESHDWPQVYINTVCRMAMKTLQMSTSMKCSIRVCMEGIKH